VPLPLSQPPVPGGEPIGFVDRAQSTIAFDDASRVFTITPVGTSFDYYSGGLLRTKDAAESVTLADVDGLHFVYYAGTQLTHSTTAWTLEDPNVVPVAAVLYDTAVGNKGILLEERHGIVMDGATHLRLHSVDGAKLVSGGTCSGYVPNASTADTDTNFGISSTVIADEDLRSTLPALADGDAITRMWRTGADGTWTWDSSATFPKVGVSGTYIAKNVLSGTWGLADIGNNSFVNWWLLAIPSAANPYVLIPGQTEHSTLSLATAETISSLSWGSVPFTEAVPLARVTYGAKSSYSGTTGKCQVNAFTRLLGATVTVTGAQTTTLGSTAITYTPNDPTDWADPDPTTVQEALDTLATAAPGSSVAADDASLLLATQVFG
jgi:hypothetical protein